MEEKIAARTQTFSLRKRSRTVLNFCWKVRWSTSGNHNLFLPKCHGGLKIITISGIRCLDYPICFRFIDRWFCDMGECAHPLTIGVLMLAGSKTRFIYFVMTRLATSITSLRSCDSGYFLPEHFFAAMLVSGLIFICQITTSLFHTRLIPRSANRAGQWLHRCLLRTR